MNIFNIESGFDFLSRVADFAVEKANGDLALSNWTILLPSRRSCNELKRIFLEKSGGAILLPKIKAIGDIDYDDLLLKQFNSDDFNEFVEFSSNTSRVKYKILLIKELLKWSKLSNKELFKNANIEQISNLALELEKFLNEVVKSGLNLDNLDKEVVDDEYSKHWQEILSFLQNFGKKWNKFVEENNIISTLSFKTKMIEFNAKFFEKNKPTNPIIIAGVNGNVRAVSELIKNLIKYDNCYFIFKGLDKNLSDVEWEKINIFHPQYYFKNLLKFINFERLVVKNIGVGEKNKLGLALSYSMLPYFYTYKWQDKLALNEQDLKNISKIECDGSFEELNVISCILKYNHEISEKTMAVITTDENFANRLEIKLDNLGLKVNNAFGNKISRTEFVKYLFLIIDVIKSDFETIALLSLLKHRFSLFGYEKEELNNLIMKLEDDILRGYGNIGLKGILKRINDKIDGDELKLFFEKIVNFLKFKNNKTFTETLKNHIKIAEVIASNNNTDSSNIFYSNEKNGDEVLNFFNELIIESEEYGEVKDINEYSYLLDYLIAENSYVEKYTMHPTISIISPQEARLIKYDLVIISNLNDGSFPPHITTDPWMSKSMRKNFGLAEKEEIIGAYAYDFVELLNNNEIILTRALKDGGVPTTKSKYLMRLETFLSCQDLKIQENSIWKEVFKVMNRVDEKKTINRPKPTPPLNERPKELYATKIEKLINNPYDIYVEKILKLKRKENFYEDKIFAVFGSAVHEALENYIKNYDSLNKDKLFEELIKFGKISFEKHFVNEISRELFFVRFINIAKWFIREDEAIRQSGYKVFAERIEKYHFEDLNFTIAGKIDRIEESEAGNINIVDYKTGTAPTQAEVKSGNKPQLSIEAVILSNQGKKVEKLAYWVIKGKNSEEIKNIKVDIDELTAKAEDGLKKLITYFNEFEHSYIATCYELANRQYSSDYKHLSRVEEWGYL
ncbi:MAG: double-strand break repair protein AddB [Rickettsiales bacterium]|nr:double-strand break repair protein AddB [Rickettsiales bacterium]